jgi:hypothetical protein
MVGTSINVEYRLRFSSSGRILLHDMERQILDCQQLGLSVFFIGITAGSTVLGAFDPIDDVATICRRHRIWLHVDVGTSRDCRSCNRYIFSGCMGWLSFAIAENQASSTWHR